MRLSADQFEPALYKLPKKDSKAPAFISYSVTPSGKVWVLAQNKEGVYQVFGFDSDTDEPSETNVRVPAHVFAVGFTVAEDGRFLFSGFFDQQAAKDLQGRRYVALFDSSGRVVKNLDSAEFKAVKLGDVGKKVLNSAVAIGSDGNFYFSSEDTIQVFSPGGDFVRSLPFDKPDPDATTWWLAPSGGLISVEFTKTSKGGDVEMQFLVLDEATGRPYGFYVPSSELGNNAVCFASATGFKFLRVSDGKLHFLTAPLL